MIKRNWIGAALLAVLALLALPTWASDKTEGVVRKVDREGGKVTIQHQEIKSLEMPPMTMVFRAKTPALLEGLKPGDKIRFEAEKGNPGYVLTAVEPAP